MEKKKTAFTVTLAVMSFVFLAQSTAATNPIMQKLIEAYPEVPSATVRMVSTLPSILGMVFGMIFGAIIGKKISWKSTMLIGLALIGIGGVLPAWINSNFTVVLAERALLGIGIGTTQCRNAIIMKIYDEQNRAAMLGRAVLIANLGSTVFSFLTGVLGESRWQNAFYVYFFAVAAFVVVLLFMREPEKDEPVEVKVEAAEVNTVKESLGWKPWFYGILALIATVILYPLLSGMATFLSVKNLGSSTIAGTILSLYTLGGAASGLIFSAMNKKLKRWMLPVAWALMVVGQAAVLYVNNIAVIAIGTVVCGIGYMLTTPCMTNYLPYEVPKSRQSFATTIIFSGVQLGVFVSSYWITFINKVLSGVMNSDIENSFLACCVIALIAAVLFAVFDIRPKELKAKDKE